MDFNRRSPVPPGLHALLAPSDYHWINYDEDKLSRVFFSRQQSQRGTRLHALAHEAIALGIRLPTSKKTMNQYVNDGIGFKMQCEVMLFYSDNCFGHADCISFKAQTRTLRISDLKTGLAPASPKQLEVYDALFCLEYKFSPFDILHELRIYQNDEVLLHVPDPAEIFQIMEKIKHFSKHLDYLKMEDS